MTIFVEDAKFIASVLVISPSKPRKYPPHIHQSEHSSSPFNISEDKNRKPFHRLPISHFHNTFFPAKL